MWSHSCLKTYSLKLNPYVFNAPFLYPLKTSENRKVFLCFQGVEKKGYIGDEWVYNTSKIKRVYYKFYEYLIISS